MSKILYQRDLATLDDILSLQTKTECISTQDIIVLGNRVGSFCTG